MNVVCLTIPNRHCDSTKWQCTPLQIMAKLTRVYTQVRVVEFSREVYKIKQIFCQKSNYRYIFVRSSLHQLSHNMTTYCSLNYKFNTGKFQAHNMDRTCCVQKLILTFRTIYVHNMFSPCSEKIRASDKDLPVTLTLTNLTENYITVPVRFGIGYPKFGNTCHD